MRAMFIPRPTLFLTPLITLWKQLGCGHWGQGSSTAVNITQNSVTLSVHISVYTSQCTHFSVHISARNRTPETSLSTTNYFMISFARPPLYMWLGLEHGQIMNKKKCDPFDVCFEKQEVAVNISGVVYVRRERERERERGERKDIAKLMSLTCCLPSTSLVPQHSLLRSPS